MPSSHYIQVGLPVRAAWRLLSIDGDDSLSKQNNPWFLLFKIWIAEVEGVKPSSPHVLSAPSPQAGMSVHFSSMIGPSLHHHSSLKSSHSCVPPAPVSTAWTTVVPDQIQTFSVSIFVKDSYAWFNGASCSCRRLLLLRTKVCSPACCVVMFFSFLFPAILQKFKASVMFSFLFFLWYLEQKSYEDNCHFG